MKTVTKQPQEWKLVSLRECPSPEEMQLCEGPEQAAKYWEAHVEAHAHFNSECECLVVLLLNTRRKIKGHHLVSIGVLDQILSHPREVFRLAIVAAASAIVVMHNHPSGEPAPSDADIRCTRELIKAGQLLKIEVCDHVIMGHQGKHASLKALGFFTININILGFGSTGRAFPISNAPLVMNPCNFAPFTFALKTELLNTRTDSGEF